MITDQHVHTVLCKHAKGDIRDYVAHGREKQLPCMCFTDHAPAPCGYDAACRMSLAQFSEYKSMVAGVDNAGGPVILFGVEADYYDGCESFLRGWLAGQEFDLVLGSIHYIRDWGFDNPANRRVWDTVDVASVYREYFGIVERLADTGLYDVVGHLDLPKKFGHRPADAAVREMVQPALDRVAAAGMGIEINTSGLRKPVGEMYPSPEILALARERDIPICFGSDAHAPTEVGHAFDEAVELALKCGYTQYMQFSRRVPDLVPF